MNMCMPLCRSTHIIKDQCRCGHPGHMEKCICPSQATKIRFGAHAYTIVPYICLYCCTHWSACLPLYIKSNVRCRCGCPGCVGKCAVHFKVTTIRFDVHTHTVVYNGVYTGL